MDGRGASFKSYQEIPNILSNRSDYNINWKELRVKSANQQEITHIRPLCFGGGYSYRQSNQLHLLTRNRFLYWKIDYTFLELTEISFDFNLINTNLRIKFEDSHIAGEPCIHETIDHVLILVTTSTGIFRFQFIHPNKQLKDITSLSTSTDVQSIFSNASLSSCLGSSNYYLYPSSGPNMSTCVSTGSMHTLNDCSVYAFSNQSGSIIFFKLPHPSSFNSGGVVVKEIKHQGVMSRLLGGLVTSVMRSSAAVNESCTSMCLFEDEEDNVFICAVTWDYKIKLWSTGTMELMFTEEKLNDPSIDVDKNNSFTGSKNMIKKYVHEVDGEYAVLIAAYFYMSTGSQFRIYQVINWTHKSSMKLICQVLTSQANVIDYIFDSEVLFVLFESQQDGQYIKYHYIDSFDQQRSMENDTLNTGWFDVTMHPGLSRDISVPSHLDPRQLYIDLIFHPTTFSNSIICSALASYKRATSVYSEKLKGASRCQLKNEVCEAIEHKLQQTACELDYDMEESEFLDLHQQQWSQFYANCVYFYKQTMKCLSLMKDAQTGLLVVVKATDVSVLRSCDVIDRYHLGSGQDYDAYGLDVPHYLKCFPNAQLSTQKCSNLQKLRECLMIVSQSIEVEGCLWSNNLDDENDVTSTFNTFDYNPKELAEKHLRMTFNDLDVKLSGLTRHCMEMMVNTLSMLVDMIDHSVIESCPLNDDAKENIDDDAGDADELAYQALERQLLRLFSSREGMRSLCLTINQSIIIKYRLAWNVLSFMSYLKMKVQQGHLLIELDRIMAQLVLVMHMHRSIIWSLNLPVLPINFKYLEMTKQAMTLMKMTDDQVKVTPLTEQATMLTLMELFIVTEGRNRIMKDLMTNMKRHKKNHSTPEIWSDWLPIVANRLQLCLWPVLSGPRFVLNLMLHGQHVHVQTYVHNMMDRMADCVGTLNFIMGLSCLITGEPQKALHHLMSVGDYLEMEDELARMVVGVHSDYKKTHYYLLVMELLEEFDLPSYSIDVAHSILPFVSSSDPKLVILWIKVFKNSMMMCQYNGAFTAILKNADKDSRRDCLRQYFMNLYDNKEFGLIGMKVDECHDPFIIYELMNLFEVQARSTDFIKQSFYELLFAIHHRKHNYQAAATTAYELGMRWGYDVGGMEGLNKMVHWIRTCVSCLNLLDPMDAYIVRPAELTMNKTHKRTSRKSFVPTNEKILSQSSIPPQRQVVDVDDNDMTMKVDTDSNVVVLNLSDIERENYLSYCLLSIYNLPTTDKKILWKSVRLCPLETLGLLCSAGLYDRAFTLAEYFNMSCVDVFESLVMRCIRLSRQPPLSSSSEQPTDWLEYNQYSSDVDKQHYTSADRAWRLLKFSLENYEPASTLTMTSTSRTKYHRALSNKLLSYDFVLPSWFIASYKQLDAPELMHQLWEYDQVTLLTDVIVDYVQAVGGHGRQAFNLIDDLQHQPTFLPYTIIHDVMNNLKLLTQAHPAFKKMFDRLEKVMNDHIKLLGTRTEIYFLML